MRIIYFLLALIAFVCPAYAQTEDANEEELTPEQLEYINKFFTDSIQGNTGIIKLPDDHCSIEIPEGFVFLDFDETRHLLVDYWDNPEESLDNVLGSLVKESAAIFLNVETAYVISYDAAGYVSDEDAISIDYDDLLKSMQEDYKEANKENPEGRQWELLGWAWTPTYDNQKKVLSWAKHLRIDNESEIINYDVRVLGKDGFVVITAVASPDAKDELLADNQTIINSVHFDEGYKYSDFNPDRDHVAEWTIGGLIAGKVLAKAGFCAFLAKFSKIFIVVIVGLYAAMRKKIKQWFSKKGDSDDNSKADGQNNN